MAIDASIPLQAVNQVQPPNLIGQATQGLQLKSLVDEDTQRKQQIQQQQALMDAYKTTDTSTDEGKQELIKKVSQINPQMGQKLSADFDTHKEVQAHTAEANAKAQESQMQINDAKMQNIGDVANDILSNYNSIASKAGPQAAWQQVQPVIQQRIQSMQLEKGPDGKPLYSVDELKQFSSVQSPQQLETAASHSHNWFKQKDQQRADAELGEREKHDRAEERNQSAEVGVKQQDLDLRRAERADKMLTPDEVSGMAKDVADHKVDLKTEFSRMTAPDKAKVQAEIKKTNPDFSMESYDAEHKVIQSYTSGKDHTTINKIDTATDHLATYKELAQAFKSGDSRLINQAKAKWVDQFGGAAPGNLELAGQLVADEVNNAAVGAGGGGVGERGELKERFSPSNSPDQAIGAADTATKLLAGKLHTYNREYDGAVSDKTRERLPFAKTVGLSDATKKAMGVKDDSKNGDHPSDISDLLKKYGG
jgi:hypothetical protein